MKFVKSAMRCSSREKCVVVVKDAGACLARVVIRSRIASASIARDRRKAK